MAMYHDFGIIPLPMPSINFRYVRYTPERYHCIMIHDDDVRPILRDMLEVNTFRVTRKDARKGLAYYSTTLIPPESLDDFRAVIERHADHPGLKPLEKLIIQAKEGGQYIIHYGLQVY